MWGRQFQFPLEEKIIRRRASRKKAYLEAAFELGTRLVHGLVAFQQLHDKNSEVLVRSGAHRDGHGTHARGAAQMNLMEKKATLKMERISLDETFSGHFQTRATLNFVILRDCPGSYKKAIWETWWYISSLQQQKGKKTKVKKVEYFQWPLRLAVCYGSPGLLTQSTSKATLQSLLDKMFAHSQGLSYTNPPIDRPPETCPPQ